MSRRKQREERSRNLGDIVLWFFHSAAYSDLREQQLNLYKDLLFIPLAAYKTQKHQKHHKAQKHHHSLITLF